MRCPKCGKDVELQNKQVGVDENGKPIFNEYAICRDCKKQWNLDKQKVKKVPADGASDHTQPTTLKPVTAVAKAAPKATVPAKSPANDRPAGDRPVRKTSAPGNTSSEKGADPAKETTRTRNTVPAQEDTPVRKAAPAKEGAPGRKAAPAKEGTPARKVGPAKEGAPVRNAASAKEGAPVRNAVSAKEGAPVRNAASAKEGAPVRKTSSAKEGAPVRKASPGEEVIAMKDTADRRKPVSKKRPAAAQAEPAEEIQKYANIPPEKVRTKRERAVRQNYEDMLSTDSERKPTQKKKPAPIEDIQTARKSSNSNKTALQKKPEPQPQNELTDIDEPEPKFKLPRIIFGIISLVAFAFFAYKGFMTGLDSISSGKNATTGTIYIVLALCMLVAGLLLLIMQKKSSVFAFVLPMLFYLGSAVFAFLKRGDDKFLLYGAAAGAVLGIIFLILTFASSRGNEYDDYDDPFEDDSFDDDFEE